MYMYGYALYILIYMYRHANRFINLFIHKPYIQAWSLNIKIENITLTPLLNINIFKLKPIAAKETENRGYSVRTTSSFLR